LNFSGTRTNRQIDGQSPNEHQRKPDIKAMQKMMSLNLFEMKVFGFSDNEPDDQQLFLPGSANIAFSWDSMDVMHIEYFIPLTMFGDVSSLNQKDISIGWEIHAFEMPKAKAGSENPSMENRSSGQGGFRGGSGRRSGGYGDGSNNKYRQEDREKMMEEQKVLDKIYYQFSGGEKTF
jgi:hypothetical protein